MMLNRKTLLLHISRELRTRYSKQHDKMHFKFPETTLVWQSRMVRSLKIASGMWRFMQLCEVNVNNEPITLTAGPMGPGAPVLPVFPSPPFGPCAKNKNS